MAEQCVIHGTFKEGIMNVLTGKCLRLFERDEDSGVLTHRSCQKNPRRRHGLLSSLRCCTCSFVVPWMCLSAHVMVDVDGEAFSCHHAHSTSKGADKAPR